MLSLSSLSSSYGNIFQTEVREGVTKMLTWFGRTPRTAKSKQPSIFLFILDVKLDIIFISFLIKTAKSSSTGTITSLRRDKCSNLWHFLQNWTKGQKSQERGQTFPPARLEHHNWYLGKLATILRRGEVWLNWLQRLRVKRIGNGAGGGGDEGGGRGSQVPRPTWEVGRENEPPESGEFYLRGF